MSRHGSRIVYVGNLLGDIREREVEDLFSKVASLREGVSLETKLLSRVLSRLENKHRMGEMRKSQPFVWKFR
ncbi:Serine/arginine-rich-splicing factor [Arachis hypogaea]|nr:Serine/arginine-rich-splicing factor [Arachis hypogaea]